MNNRTLVVNAVIAALYIAISLLSAPLAFGAIQFRIAEMFNHLVVFNKKYFYGIVVGVIITNLFSPVGLYEILFGLGQTVMALSITIFSAKFIKGIWNRMMFNTAIFTFTMFMIALQLNIALEFPFWITWFTVAVGGFAVMMIGAPIMLALNKRLNFEKLI